MLILFVMGGAAAVLIDSLIDLVKTRARCRADADVEASPWGIYFGVSVDLFSDGVIIGAGSIVNPALGLLLALGQVPAEIPEGFATIATFRNKEVPRGRRLALAASFAIPIFIGATIGFWGVGGQPDAVKLGLLAFTAGILLTVAVEEIFRGPRSGGQALGEHLPCGWLRDLRSSERLSRVAVGAGATPTFSATEFMSTPHGDHGVCVLEGTSPAAPLVLANQYT